jgi:hypothetical protein
MTPLDPTDAAAEAADDERVAEPDEHFPARRLLAHDQDDSWLLDDLDGWRPID